MAKANPLWGAPRIHGELQKLGIEVAERTVSRLLPKRRSRTISATVCAGRSPAGWKSMRGLRLFPMRTPSLSNRVM